MPRSLRALAAAEAPSGPCCPRPPPQRDALSEACADGRCADHACSRRGQGSPLILGRHRKHLAQRRGTEFLRPPRRVQLLRARDHRHRRARLRRSSSPWIIQWHVLLGDGGRTNHTSSPHVTPSHASHCTRGSPGLLLQTCAPKVLLADQPNAVDERPTPRGPPLCLPARTAVLMPKAFALDERSLPGEGQKDPPCGTFCWTTGLASAAALHGTPPARAPASARDPRAGPSAPPNGRTCTLR